MSWQNAFVAMSAAIGEPLDAALGALGEEASAVRALESVLRSSDREKRARALAQHLAPIATELGAMEATWRA